MFSDASVPFDALRGGNADGDIAIDRLMLASDRTLDRLHVKFSLRDGKLDAPTVQVSAYGGTITGSVVIDATRGNRLPLRLRQRPWTRSRGAARGDGCCP
jgi:hypothetical protein